MIFTPFKRLHGSEIPGTGLGLAMCQKIVQRYHGRIWVDFDPGAGIDLSFHLAAVDGRTGCRVMPAATGRRLNGNCSANCLD